MRLLLNKDANIGGESSNSSATGANNQSDEQDANNQSSSTDNKGAKETTGGEVDGKSDKTPQSIADEIKKKYNIDQPKEEKSDSPTDAEANVDKKSKEKSPVLKQNETPEEKTARESKEKAEALKTPDDKLPFHNHPRFKQVIEERNKFEQELSQYKPDAERMRGVEQYCVKNNIPPQDYDESLRIAALVRNDPAQALTKLKGIVQALEIQTGASLPADLQAQVDDGKIPLSAAQEMSKLRLQSAQSEQRVKQEQKTAQERAQQRLVQSLDSWTNSKRVTDPSFKPKQQGQEDGKFELVTSNFLALWNQTPPRDETEAIKLAEQAYNTVHQFIERTLPKPRVSRPLSGNKHAANQQQNEKPVDIRKPGWAKEVAKRHFTTAN